MYKNRGEQLEINHKCIVSLLENPSRTPQFQNSSQTTFYATVSVQNPTQKQLKITSKLAGLQLCRFGSVRVFRRVSSAIWSRETEQDFGVVVCHSKFVDEVHGSSFCPYCYFLVESKLRESIVMEFFQQSEVLFQLEKVHFSSFSILCVLLVSYVMMNNVILANLPH